MNDTEINPRGYLVPIGGAEDKSRQAPILRRFVELCGGAEARIAVIATASELSETGPGYVRLFEELGAGQAAELALRERRDCSAAPHFRILADATGVFFTGGNQLRITSVLGGTRFATVLAGRHCAGLHVAGTSAGAACLSEHMIAGGKSGYLPRPGLVHLAPGLGLTGTLVLDQHFRQRHRLGRLLTALVFNPFLIGLGLDEDSAAFIAPDDTLEAAGSGAVTVIDPTDLEFSTIESTRANRPVSVAGIRMHVLTAGARFDIASRRAQL